MQNEFSFSILTDVRANRRVINLFCAVTQRMDYGINQNMDIPLEAVFFPPFFPQHGMAVVYITNKVVGRINLKSW